MAVTNYFTVDGQLYGEEAGGTFRGYVPDALGSVMVTTTTGTSAQNTYRYKPYGEQLAKTGAGADPRFKWVGTSGSRASEISGAEQYNRSRHYSIARAIWSTADMYWPSVTPYMYANVSPITYFDPSGNLGCKTVGGFCAICPKFAFLWSIMWVLPKPSPNGYIVQKVQTKTIDWDCKDALQGRLVPFPIWEIWEVKKDVIYDGWADKVKDQEDCSDNPGGQDDWASFPPKDVQCKHHRVEYEGEACYFPGLIIPVKSKEDDWSCGENFAKGLPSRPDAPGFWAGRDPANCIKRTLVVDFKCCCYDNCNPKVGNTMICDFKPMC